MKKVLMLGIGILFAFSLYAQEGYLSEFVSEWRGDTAVIIEGTNTLGGALQNDTLCPDEGRVYLLTSNCTYSLAQYPSHNTQSGKKVEILGDYNNPVKTNTQMDPLLPVICGYDWSGGGIRVLGDVTVKNCAIVVASASGSLGWAFWALATPYAKLTLDNCVLERNRWVFVTSNDAPNTSLFIKNCYFTNMIGQSCRRNGGVFDNVNYVTDTIWVENSTHVWAQGMVYKFRSYQVEFAYFNHNTFVNISNDVFENCGYVTNLAVTNNIFVNCNVQPYFPGLDAGETDPDGLPTGLVNVDTLTEQHEQKIQRAYITNNLVYWDSKLLDIADIANDQQISGHTDWVSQMIKMNDRTQQLFNDDVNYPFLTEGSWIEGVCPSFANPRNLLTDLVDTLKTFSLACLPENSPAVLPDFRFNLVGSEFYNYPDWPVAVDLSYTDSDLLTAGLYGYPLGDLDWFPANKANWLEIRQNEIDHIVGVLKNGPGGVEAKDLAPRKFVVHQNYPNPFNPVTKLTFELPTSGKVTVKVYNLLGQEVATLLNNEYKNAGSVSVDFDGSSLASGVYIYTVKFGDMSVSKKMILMK